MASLKFELEADVRQDVGKGASRRLRQTNKIPAIVYGADLPAVSLTLDHNKVVNVLANQAVYSHILTLKTGKQVEKVILKSLQRHPAKPRIQHMDFLRIRADQKLHMHVPLHFLGEEKAPGLKEGGVFSHLMSDVEVSCLPENLPEAIELDVSNLELDHTLHLSDLKLPKGVTLVAFAHGEEGHNHPVITIHKPRIIEEEVVVATEETAEETGTEAATSAAEASKPEDKKE